MQYKNNTNISQYRPKLNGNIINFVKKRILNKLQDLEYTMVILIHGCMNLKTTCN